MNRKRFSDILKEYGYNDKQIELLWKSRPSGSIDEQKLRKTAKICSCKGDEMSKPRKDSL